MLVRLEAFGIMGHEYLALFHIPHPLDVSIPVKHLGWVIGQPDARQNILRQVLPQVAGIASQYHGAGLGQTYNRHLASGSVTRRTMNVDATVSEQIEITVQLDHRLSTGRSRTCLSA